VDSKRLDAYPGYYLLGDTAVLTVKREDEHLSVQLTGQPFSPVFPESQTLFFATIVDAQFDFQTDAAGGVTGVILHQFGQAIALPRTDAATAGRVTERTQARVKAQTQSPGTEAAVRRLDSGTATGAPPYDAMTESLANMTRPQVPRIQAYLAELGPIQDVRFLGVNPQGADVYNIRHANGIARWTLALDTQGRIAAARVTPGP
jgi:hypothetical protein